MEGFLASKKFASLIALEIHSFNRSLKENINENGNYHNQINLSLTEL